MESFELVVCACVVRFEREPDDELHAFAAGDPEDEGDWTETLAALDRGELVGVVAHAGHEVEQGERRVW